MHSTSITSTAPTRRGSPPAQAGAIVARGLSKAFGTQTVLDGIDLDVARGSVFALLGPNGAGKTTTVRILSTLLPADAGEVRVDGHDVAKQGHLVRRAIGVTGQFSAVDNLLTGEENLRLMADLRHVGKTEGTKRVAELLERFDLADAAKRAVATYSGGMKRRLDLAMTLIGEPSIVFLDEPTAGLDPRSRRTMWEMVAALVKEGVTIFLTTQYLEEADRLADRIAVLDGGRIVAVGTAQELKRLVPGGHIEMRFVDLEALRTAADLIGEATTDEEQLVLTVPGQAGVASLRGLLDRLDMSGIEAESLSIHSPDLDDVFLALTGDARTEREVS